MYKNKNVFLYFSMTSCIVMIGLSLILDASTWPVILWASLSCGKIEYFSDFTIKVVSVSLTVTGVPSGQAHKLAEPKMLSDWRGMWKCIEACLINYWLYWWIKICALNWWQLIMTLENSEQNKQDPEWLKFYGVQKSVKSHIF